MSLTIPEHLLDTSDRKQAFRNIRQWMEQELQGPSKWDQSGISSGCESLDELLMGGYPEGKITELVESRPSFGAQTLLDEALNRAYREQRYLALVDAFDQFDPDSALPEALNHLLWVQCSRAEEALKACDIILRDDHFPLLLVDLRTAGIRKMRSIAAPLWYRLQRVSEQSATAMVVFSSRSLVPCAYHRFQLTHSLSLNWMDAEASPLASLQFEILKRRVLQTPIPSSPSLAANA